MTAAIRVGLVDDQALFRTGIRMLLQSQPDLEFVGEAGNGREGIDLVATARPDVVLMDIRMPVMDGIEATERIVQDAVARSSATPRVIVLTTFDLDEAATRAIRGGASGFLLKDTDPEFLLAAIRTVHQGRKYVTPEVAQMLVDNLNAPETEELHASLSERELQTLQKIASASYEENLEDARSLGELYKLIRSVRVPVIAAVRGRALAGGCGLAMACDLIVAETNAKFGFPEVKIGFVPAMVAAVVTVGICSSAYVSEIWRGAIIALPKGQAEAAVAIGMRPSDIWVRVILPQAFRISLPALINELILLVKASSLVSVVGILELTRASQAQAGNGRPLSRRLTSVASVRPQPALSPPMAIRSAAYPCWSRYS